MKKILIVTWYDNNNYGTVLQAYSLKTVIEDPCITGLTENLKSWQYKCELLPHKPERMRKGSKWSKLFCPKAYKIKLGYARDRLIYRLKRGLFEQREKEFKEFITENFEFAANHDVQEYNELKTIEKDYDYVLSGSDQIWNPEALDPVYLLEWVPSGKKISYGSSLSVKRIQNKDEHIFRSALKGFKTISIRDSSCRHQLENIVGKSIVTVVDPVILLGKNGLLKQSKRLELSPYLFCYFLGNNRYYRKLAVTESQNNRLQIHAVINVGSDFPADKELEKFADWNVDPWKFVSYINEAEIVITDSFHATVISVLCHTNFVVLEKDAGRPEQNNRILEFLNAVGLSERWGAASLRCQISAEQWRKADEALLHMRMESFKYLLEALQ